MVGLKSGLLTELSVFIIACTLFYTHSIHRIHLWVELSARGRLPSMRTCVLCVLCPVLSGIRCVCDICKRLISSSSLLVPSSFFNSIQQIVHWLLFGVWLQFGCDFCMLRTCDVLHSPFDSSLSGLWWSISILSFYFSPFLIPSLDIYRGNFLRLLTNCTNDEWVVSQ